MGLAFASKYTADHLVWAPNWPQTLLPMVSYGPITGPTCAADGIAWAQHWPKSMALYVPSTGHKIYCRSSCMGPELASTNCHMGPALVPKYVTDCLAWAQHCPQNMVLMVLYGPSICFKIYSRSSCMGPELSSKYRAN